MATESSDARGRGLVRRTVDLIAPDPTASTSAQRAKGVVAGAGLVAATGTAITGGVELGLHNTALLATADPFLLTAAVAAGIGTALGTTGVYFSDDTDADSPEERQHFVRSGSALRRIKAGSIALGLGVAALGVGLDATGVTGGAAAHTLLMVGAGAGGLAAGAGLAGRTLPRKYRNLPVQQLGE